MIIFDLDGTLADCEHRRHFVDLECLGTREDYEKWIKPFVDSRTCPQWSPDYKAYNEACGEDKPIISVIYILEYIGEGEDYGACDQSVDYSGVQIWSGRCESIRKKTEKWLTKHVRHYYPNRPNLRMRPEGDNTPLHELKEKWLDEAIREDKTIDFVFDSDQESIAMYRRRGIFVFDCNQGKHF